MIRSEPTSSTDGGRRRLITPGRVALAVGLLAGILYAFTLSPTFGFIDKGELAAVAGTFGVAHPTGYPLLTLLGGLVALLPGRDVVLLNIFALLMTAGGAGVLVLLFERMLRVVEGTGNGEQGTGRREGRKGKGREEKGKGSRVGMSLETSPGRQEGRGNRETGNGIREMGKGETDSDPTVRADRSLVAGLAALFVATIGIWWRQSTGFEVYALHCLMLPLIVWLFLRYLDEEETPARMRGGGFTRRGVLFALALGLSFSNHMTTVFLAPAFLLYFVLRLGVSSASLRRILYLAPGFLVGLLPYLWLPLRAASDPRLNWGNPETFWAFRRHIGGAQYGVWMFSNVETFARQTALFLGLLGAETLYVGMALALLGIVALLRKHPLPLALVIGTLLLGILVLSNVTGSVAVVVMLVALLLIALPVVSGLVARRAGESDAERRRRHLLLFLAVLFLSTLLLAGSYDILDIEPYYLAAIVAVGAWVAFGLDHLARLAGRTTSLAVGALLPIAMVVATIDTVDESDNHLVEDVTVAMLESLPPDAVVISGLWDFWLSGSFYMQEVEGMRSDVIVVDHNLLKYSWYLDQLEANHPAFMARVADEVAAFRREQYKFERDLPYDAAVIDRHYVAMIDAMIATNLRERPVVVTFDLNETGPDRRLRYGAAWAPPNRRIPYQLGYLLLPAEGYVPQEFPTWSVRKRNGPPDPYAASSYEWLATSARDRAQYELMNGDHDLALRYLDLALSFDPGWDPDDVARLPENGERRVGEVMATFAQIRAMRNEVGNRE